MSCPSCASSNQSEFPVEMIIHLTGLKNVNNPGVLLFPRLLICLDCGFLRYKVPGAELRLLGRGSSKSEWSTGEAEYSESGGLETVSGTIPN
jgi:hypothetical protein